MCCMLVQGLKVIPFSRLLPRVEDCFNNDMKVCNNYAILSPPLVSNEVIHLCSLTGISDEAVSIITVALKTNYSLQTLK